MVLALHNTRGFSIITRSKALNKFSMLAWDPSNEEKMNQIRNFETGIRRAGRVGDCVFWCTVVINVNMRIGAMPATIAEE